MECGADYSMMTEEYTIKIYADAVECGIRDIETIPSDYRKKVENELYIREKKRLS